MGELVHVIADCRFDRHIPAVKAMLELDGYPRLPSGWMSITDFTHFTKDSFSTGKLSVPTPFNWEIPMAI